MPGVPGFNMGSGATLPPTAPRIRITAGTGTAGQKTWNVRRPVTVIGSGRQSTIVLTDQAVSKAHCAIINTGDAVLLKDLCSDCGTVCNGEPVNLTLLKDGDVITAADTRIQIAIHQSVNRNSETHAGVRLCDPVHLAEPLLLWIHGGSRCWTIEESVCLIGRRPRVRVHLDHPDVSLAHALLFCLNGKPAVCDLGSRTGIRVNGRPVTCSVLAWSDRLTIGPFEMFLAARLPDSAREPDRASTPGTFDTPPGTSHSDSAALSRRGGASRGTDLEPPTAWLLAQAQQLNEREAALESKAAELCLEQQRLREWQERLIDLQRQIEAREKAIPAGTLDTPPEGVVFTGAVGSAESPVALWAGKVGDSTREARDQLK